LDKKSLTIKIAGNQLAALRNEKGLNQEDLGEKIGYSTQTINNWEAKKYFKIPIEVGKTLAKILEISIDDLINVKTTNIISEDGPVYGKSDLKDLIIDLQKQLLKANTELAEAKSALSSKDNFINTLDERILQFKEYIKDNNVKVVALMDLVQHLTGKVDELNKKIETLIANQN
jgi:putative transcriptional regulator